MAAGLPQHDLDVIRRLAERKLALANDPINQERKRAWYNLDAGVDHRVMVLAEHGGIRDENRPGPTEPLECTDPFARRLESGLRQELYQFDHLKADHVLEPFVNCGWRWNLGNYGVETVNHTSDAEVSMGAKTWEHPIKDLDADFDKLKQREFSVDREATEQHADRLRNIFDGILPVRMRSKLGWTFGLTNPLINLIGLENLMLYMFDNPDGLHRIMGFLRDEHIRMAKWAESEGLLTLDNENNYVGSGSMGYSRALPQADMNGKVRTKDQWVLLESQETVGVGPNQFEEFIFPYQESIAKIFGRVYYGCCEPVHTRWNVLKKMSNLARVSISPWADEEYMAEALGMDYVYSRKPNPTLISTEVFDEAAIREDLRKTLTLTKGQRVEIIMKDVHTLNNEPERLSRWVQLAREEIAAIQ